MSDPPSLPHLPQYSAPGGASWLGCALNCFVHCVMYGYYFLAGLGPAVRRYLWWKRYLTQLQMIQFSIILIHIISMRVSKGRARRAHRLQIVSAWCR